MSETEQEVCIPDTNIEYIQKMIAKVYDDGRENPSIGDIIRTVIHDTKEACKRDLSKLTVMEISNEPKVFEVIDDVIIRDKT